MFIFRFSPSPAKHRLYGSVCKPTTNTRTSFVDLCSMRVRSLLGSLCIYSRIMPLHILFTLDFSCLIFIIIRVRSNFFVNNNIQLVFCWLKLVIFKLVSSRFVLTASTWDTDMVTSVHRCSLRAFHFATYLERKCFTFWEKLPMIASMFVLNLTIVFSLKCIK